MSAIAKKAGGFALGALIGKGGSKFGGLDIKRVYFGCVNLLLDHATGDILIICIRNWLRDYSQVCGNILFVTDCDSEFPINLGSRCFQLGKVGSPGMILLWCKERT